MLAATSNVGNPVPGGTVDRGYSSREKLSRIRRWGRGAGAPGCVFIFPAHEVGTGRTELPEYLGLIHPLSSSFLMEVKILLGLHKHSKTASFVEK